VSSAGQSLDIQNEALALAGCEKVFAEKMSGRSSKDRIELASAIDFVRDGDKLVVTRLDRLARSVGDLHQIIEKLSAKNVQFRCLNQSGVDTDSSTGRLMLAVLGAVAQFENDIRRERQMEGIERAKASGKYKGRPPTIDPQEIKAMREQGLGASQIARQLSIGRASVYSGISSMSRLYRCPSCKATKGIAISYGYPSQELFKKAERNEAVLGGCMQALDDPDRQCLNCQHQWEIVRRSSSQTE
jgi:DNA invertase Pin-like site-specific DNA recombinase